MKTTDPDKCEALAKKAFEIYQGMKTDKRTVENWDHLTREQRGLLVWVARFAHHSSNWTGS